MFVEVYVTAEKDVRKNTRLLTLVSLSGCEWAREKEWLRLFQFIVINGFFYYNFKKQQNRIKY